MVDKTPCVAFSAIVHLLDSYSLFLSNIFI